MIENNKDLDSYIVYNEEKEDYLDRDNYDLTKP
jgi:hypothetical protein